MVKISVIVPVYNMENYLDLCLSSLVHQTFKDYEIIVINDGSTDISLDIIKNYEKEFPKRFRTFSFKNQGISKTRNYGIKVARGKYITFIDSDDYVDITFLEDMYNKIKENDSDICVCDYYTFTDKNKVSEVKLTDFEDSSIENNPQLLWKINSSPWNKLYKKDLFKNLKFEDIKYEDLLLIPKILCESKRIVKLNKCLNYYRIRENSETTTVDERVFDILKILDDLNNYFKKKKLFDKFYLEIEYFNIYRVTMYIIQQRYQKDKDIRRRFVEFGFAFLNNNFPNWRKNIYYKKRNVFKRIIESNKFLSSRYINLYRWYYENR